MSNIVTTELNQNQSNGTPNRMLARFTRNVWRSEVTGLDGETDTVMVTKNTIGSVSFNHAIKKNQIHVSDKGYFYPADSYELIKPDLAEVKKLVYSLEAINSIVLSAEMKTADKDEILDVIAFALTQHEEQ